MRCFWCGRGDDEEYCLLDIKEAVAAAALAVACTAMPRDNGKRVVEGALSPGLGNRMIATRVLDHGFFIRELLPQDMKLELDQLSQTDAKLAAGYLARVVGLAHARQMDMSTRASWMRELQACRSKTWMHRRGCGPVSCNWWVVMRKAISNIVGVMRWSIDLCE
jgi:uncharacterized protein (DUF2252 family)